MLQRNCPETDMPLTLEQHFKMLASQYPDVENLYSLWLLLRNDLEDRLPHSRAVFVHYSLHDATHSRSVIRAVERFLGDKRIDRLSATDTFMLLVCAYAHDYGMAMTFNQIYDALGEPNFVDFIKKQLEISYTLNEEDVKALQNLRDYIEENRTNSTLQEQYFCIMLVIQMYLRPTHWQGAERIWGDFRGLLDGRLNGRFIQGGEGIIDICESHGKTFQNVLKMNFRADGIVGDEFHPRFIAAMLRLGDLLDLDNGRFPRWFITEIERNRGIVPHLSVLHYKKHEAITHLLITPEQIEVCASCCSAEKGDEVASLAREWIEWLENECKEQTLYWSELAPNGFGRPPRITKNEILLDGKLYSSENCKLQMRMSQDRVMKLLEGTSIYQDQYVGIRELIQNAIDASLLQLWYDITHNRYINLGVSKFGHQISKSLVENDPKEIREANKKEMRMFEHSASTLGAIFNNYSINVELIQDMVEEKIYLVLKDKGIGIAPEDVQYIADIGTSKEKNEHITEIMQGMPRWLKPSGVFGIGLQSAFQLTDQIEFYSRRPNEPERMIVFHSYGRNHGKVEIREVPPDTDGIFYDNAVPGTNVKIAINPKKLLVNADSNKETPQIDFFYYDKEFDGDDDLHGIFVELSRVVVNKLQEWPYDYFDIRFQTIERFPDKPMKKSENRRYCHGYFNMEGSFSRLKKEIYNNSICPFFPERKQVGKPFSFSEDTAHYADEKNCRIYCVELRLGRIIQKNDGSKEFRLPAPVHDLYHFYYKFTPISNCEAIYPPPVRQLRKMHAGFLSWDINIMDDKPENYLNIDRDRLREGAVIEEEFTPIRKTILQHWCSHLISCRKKSLKQQAKGKVKGKEKNELNELLELISLTLLLYQNVSDKQFQEFIGLYGDIVNAGNLPRLAGEAFPVNRLWEKGAKFKFIVVTLSGWQELSHIFAGQGSEETDPPTLIENKDTISALPHRLIHIDKISLDEDGAENLAYYMHLGPQTSYPCKIEMDDAARLFDYSRALGPGTGKIDFAPLVRKVFKPDKKYPHLLIPKYPKTFKRGDNFSSPLDHCIRWYIISPFDRGMTRQLRQFFEEPRDPGDIITKLKGHIRDYTKQSKQFDKCVKYVCKQHLAKETAAEQLSPDESLEDVVRAEYQQFYCDCCKILIEHRGIIKNQPAGTGAAEEAEQSAEPLT